MEWSLQMTSGEEVCKETLQWQLQGLEGMVKPVMTLLHYMFMVPGKCQKGN
jgi:hypothetical protein